MAVVAGTVPSQYRATGKCDAKVSAPERRPGTVEFEGRYRPRPDAKSGRNGVRSNQGERDGSTQRDCGQDELAPRPEVGAPGQSVVPRLRSAVRPRDTRLRKACEHYDRHAPGEPRQGGGPLDIARSIPTRHLPREPLPSGSGSSASQAPGPAERFTVTQSLVRSSTGRALVSKTSGWGFEPPRASFRHHVVVSKNDAP